MSSLINHVQTKVLDYRKERHYKRYAPGYQNNEIATANLDSEVEL